MRRFTLPLLIVLGLLVAGSVEHPGSAPAGRGQPNVTYQGKPVQWWAHRAVHNRRELNRVRQVASASTVDTAALTMDFLCIHRFEGAWDANTGNGYFGGLQMDRDFQRRYGAHLYATKGTADNWTPAEQVAVAIVAYASRGFVPWPQTRKACGL